MALHWNVAPLVEREGQDWVWPMTIEGDEESRRLNGSIECVIWASLFVDMGRITDANWRQFAIRCHAWERVCGPISSSGEPLPADLIRRCIGLSTNVSSGSDTSFKKKLGETALRQAQEAVDRSVREALT